MDSDSWIKLDLPMSSESSFYWDVKTKIMHRFMNSMWSKVDSSDWKYKMILEYNKIKV